MYAKSILEQVRARAVNSGWSRYLSFAPVALALAVATMPFTLQPRVAERLAETSATGGDAAAAEPNPFEGLVQASVSTAPKRMGLPLDKQQRLIVNYITRKFGVSTEVVQDMVKTAFAAGKQYGIDPKLVVAMMAVESSFNPIAESYAGAKGLMQIIPKYHMEKFAPFGGEHTVFDPRVNIMVGTRIVREYLLLHAGDLFTALQTYAGAMADRGAVYTHRVLNEKDHLDMLAGMPKTDRRHRVTMAPEPEQPGKPITLLRPVVLDVSAPVPQEAIPAAVVPPPAMAPAPVKAVEEAAHTPPTQTPAPTPAVNLTLAQPEAQVRF